MNLIFVGPPGAGKGTQAKLVSKKFNIPHISTGDMLREAIRLQTQMGLKAKVLMDAGDLVPDDVVIGIVQDRLDETDCKNGYILDGFPRTIEQAISLDRFAQINEVVLVDVQDDILVQRIAGRRACKSCPSIYHTSTYDKDNCELCGSDIIQRTDDNEDTVRNRLKVYHRLTSPLIDYYQKKDILKSFNGNQDIDVIFEEICANLDLN